MFFSFCCVAGWKSRSEMEMATWETSNHRHRTGLFALSFYLAKKKLTRNITQRSEDACIHRQCMQAHASSLVSRASDVIFLESSVFTHHTSAVNLRKQKSFP